MLLQQVVSPIHRGHQAKKDESSESDDRSISTALAMAIAGRRLNLSLSPGSSRRANSSSNNNGIKFILHTHPNNFLLSDMVATNVEAPREPLTNSHHMQMMCGRTKMAKQRVTTMMTTTTTMGARGSQTLTRTRNEERSDMPHGKLQHNSVCELAFKCKH